MLVADYILKFLYEKKVKDIFLLTVAQHLL